MCKLSHHGILEGALVKKNDYQSKDKLYNARIQFKLLLKMFQINKAPGDS